MAKFIANMLQVVVGTDIAELLMKNTREYEYKCASNKATRNESRRESSQSGSLQEETHHSSSPPLSGAQQNDFSLSETMGKLWISRAVLVEWGVP